MKAVLPFKMSHVSFSLRIRYSKISYSLEQITPWSVFRDGPYITAQSLFTYPYVLLKGFHQKMKFYSIDTWYDNKGCLPDLDGNIGFPHCGFRLYLTLSSKSFSPFLHSTCAVSVSDMYLALGEDNLPFALHSQATLLLCICLLLSI